MTVKELVDYVKEKGRIDDIEIYLPKDNYHSLNFHGDFIESIEDDAATKKVITWELMDEKRYDETVLANSCISADFEGWYGNASATVLCVLVEDD